MDTAENQSEVTVDGNEPSITEVSEQQDLTSMQDSDLESLIEQEKTGKKKEPETVQETPDNQIKKLTEQLADKEKQIQVLQKVKEDRGSFIEKQNGVISNLQKKLDTKSQELKELAQKSSSANFWNDPNEALEARDEMKKTQEEVQNLSYELAFAQNKAKIQAVAPDYEDMIDDIVDYLKEVDPLNTTDEIVNEFKKNPYAIDPNAAMNFIQNTRLMKKFSGKTEKKPSVSNKVNQAMLHTTGTAKTASAEDEFGFGKSAVSMSDQELSAYIASLKKK